MSASGMNPKRSSDVVLWVPRPTYMNSANSAASATAMAVPSTGRVYIVRASRDRS